jgi:hypothetical protein
MKKTSSFHDCPYEGWPSPIDIKPFFSPAGWASGGNDSWGFRLIRSDGVEGAPWGNGPSTAALTMTGLPHLGVTLQYDRWTKSTRQRDSYNSRGDLSQLLKFVRSLHEDQLSLGLFVPFDQAWIATKQFLESDGVLPQGIEWINSRELPPEAFPLP